MAATNIQRSPIVNFRFINVDRLPLITIMNTPIKQEQRPTIFRKFIFFFKKYT